MPGNIPLIQTLAKDIWNEHYPGIISKEQIDYMLNVMYATKRIEEEMKLGVVYMLIKVNNAPAGYLSYFHEKADNRVKVDKIYLKKEFHGRGIGQQMLDHVYKKCVQMNIPSLYLNVNKKNEKAIRAYERFGFVKSGEINKDVGEGFFMDDFVMTCAVTR